MKTKKRINVNGTIYAVRTSIYTVNESPVHISDNMTGKMLNVCSVGTACTVNPYCQARMKRGDAVCVKCFADRALHGFKGANMRACLESNYKLLTEQVLDLDLLPRFKKVVDIVRIESFGDVGNVTHAINYINIVKLNPHVTFTAWTKNDNFWKQAFDRVGKPKNLIMVFSSLYLNKPQVPKASIKYFDHNFTVYDHETAAFYGDGFINCGARSCDTCRRCYTKGTEFSVRELLK